MTVVVWHVGSCAIVVAVVVSVIIIVVIRVIVTAVAAVAVAVAVVFAAAAAIAVPNWRCTRDVFLKRLVGCHVHHSHPVLHRRLFPDQQRPHDIRDDQ